MNRNDEKPFLGDAVGAPAHETTDAAPPTSGRAVREDEQQTPAQAQPWIPKVELPQGGGAIAGIGETFEANAFTGSGSMSIPIVTSPGRGAVAPSLGLSYASGSGNGPFGLGWSMSVPAIMRKTERELPQYRDTVESDTFMLAGAEDLVPVRDASGTRVRSERDGHAVYPYRPRVEAGFARVERWVSLQDGSTHWRVHTPDNTVARYGSSAQSRLADPEDPARVYAWKLEEARDDRGNIARYTYKPEDDAGAVDAVIAERNRAPVANLYLSRIEYGNAVPDVAADFLFEAVFDYGEFGGEFGDASGASPHEVRPWDLRPDAFSSFRAGFDMRTRRRCRRVLMFHRIAALSSEPRLVASTEFVYDDDPHLSKLSEVVQRAYAFDESTGAYRSEALPALSLSYSTVEFSPRFVEVDAQSLADVGPGVDGGEFRFVDLDGEGLPGIVSQQGDALYYKRPLGEGRFGPLTKLGQQPTTARLGQGAQLVDLDGDGRLELAVRTLGHAGAYARAAGGGWEAFEAFEQVPNIDWTDPNLQQLDLDGDGRADVLVVKDDHFIWYPSLGKGGHGPGHMLPKPAKEHDGPAVLFADGTGTVQLADMTGDGLSDIVRVENGAVHYWPNLGFGRFGRRVTMDQSPTFCARAEFQPAYIRLGDLDGSGTTDIVYLDGKGARAWLNRGGNGFSPAQPLRPFPGVDSATAVEVRDLFGKGTASLVWSTASDWAAPHKVMALDLLPQKPHLLIETNNNMGLQTRLSYEPATMQALRDTAAGRPWITTLPFPTYVVTRVEAYDAIARRRFVQTYAYHHGYYDGTEREFRGFAMVERWDTESYEDFASDGLFELALFDRTEAQLHQPPVYTKTWFHTGAYLGHQDIAAALSEEYWDGDPQGGAWQLDDTVLPDDLSARECVEATRALRGRPIRAEVYALDGTEDEGTPYSVSETNYTVRIEQPTPPDMTGRGRFGKPGHAVVFAHARESLTLHYERDAHNPRTAHAFVLDVDAFGHVTRSVQVGYPARNPEIPEQSESAVVVSENSFIVAGHFDLVVDFIFDIV